MSNVSRFTMVAWHRPLKLVYCYKMITHMGVAAYLQKPTSASRDEGHNESSRCVGSLARLAFCSWSLPPFGEGPLAGSLPTW